MEISDSWDGCGPPTGLPDLKANLELPMLSSNKLRCVGLLLIVSLSRQKPADNESKFAG